MVHWYPNENLNFRHSDMSNGGQLFCLTTTIFWHRSGHSPKVNIPINELNEYAIAEGDELNISFSLNYLCKMCCSIKLAPIIDISLSNEYPMSLKYNLGDDSKIVFYIAPNIK